MNKQLIISISRDYGSGGHRIARFLAERFDLPIYDHNLLDEMTAGKHVNKEKMAKYDEAPKLRMIHRSVRGYSNSPQDAIAEMQFKFLKDKAEAGESFVIVGRCSESVLKEYEGLIPIFVTADRDFKINRVMTERNMTEKEAIDAIARHDKKRKAYHNHFAEGKWGDSRCYDLCVNSSKLGLDGTIDFLADYIQKRIEM